MTTPVKNWKESILTVSATVRDVIESLDRSCNKIVMIVDGEGKLEGTISDGDIRRSLLKGSGLNSSIESILHRNALVVRSDIGHSQVMKLMALNRVQQIPIVDKNYLIIGLHVLADLVVPARCSSIMVIMAGGVGKRLLPHTENCPKPLLKVNGKPMLEYILDRAKSEGFEDFIISVGYLGEMIEDYFKNGEDLGVRIRYVREDSPLGTAGSLSLIREELSVAPFIVTNGDVITDIRYGDLLQFHIDQGATATMAVRLHEWRNPFGVVKTKGIDIVSFEEKPIHQSNVNAGVYAINPDSLKFLKDGEPCDMPVFFEALKSRSKRVIAYGVHENWQDVGRPEDLLNAQLKQLI
jgi:dTDP-glucose pyrophosphorylase/predicted transcriptional regulator